MGRLSRPDQIGAVIDKCPYCLRDYMSSDYLQFGCDECEKKSESWKQATWKDNMEGDGVRLENRARIARKIGGTWSGGGIDKTGGDNPWTGPDGSIAAWKKQGVERPYAKRKELLEVINEGYGSAYQK